MGILAFILANKFACSIIATVIVFAYIVVKVCSEEEESDF